MLLLCGNPKAAAAEQRTSSSATITIYGNANKPPKNYLEGTHARGAIVEIMRYIDRQMPENFQYKLYPWSRAYLNAKDGTGGLIGMSKNAERLKIFDYSDVMYYDQILLIVLAGNEFHYESIPDLKNKIVGIFRGVSFGEDFEQASNKIFTVDSDAGPKQRLLKLLHRRIDVALIGPGITSFNRTIQSDHRLIANKDMFKVLPVPFKQDPNFLGFAKNMHKTEFLARFNAVLRQGHESGKIQSIIDAEHHYQSNKNNQTSSTAP